METINLYAVFDRKGNRYDTPFFTSNDLFAQRIFHLRMQEDLSFLKEWPEDFILFQVGTFNVNTSLLVHDRRVIVEGRQIAKEKSKCDQS